MTNGPIKWVEIDTSHLELSPLSEADNTVELTQEWVFATLTDDSNLVSQEEIIFQGESYFIRIEKNRKPNLDDTDWKWRAALVKQYGETIRRNHTLGKGENPNDALSTLKEETDITLPLKWKKLSRR